MPLWPGSRTVTLIPSCANSIGGSPYSLANQHAAPLVSEEHHSASRTLTTNQPSVTGASPEPASSSRASVTTGFSQPKRRVPDLRHCAQGHSELTSEGWRSGGGCPPGLRRHIHGRRARRRPAGPPMLPDLVRGHG